MSAAEAAVAGGGDAVDVCEKAANALDRVGPSAAAIAAVGTVGPTPVVSITEAATEGNNAKDVSVEPVEPFRVPVAIETVAGLFGAIDVVDDAVVESA